MWNNGWYISIFDGLFTMLNLWLAHLSPSSWFDFLASRAWTKSGLEALTSARSTKLNKAGGMILFGHYQWIRGCATNCMICVVFNVVKTSSKTLVNHLMWRGGRPFLGRQFQDRGLITYNACKQSPLWVICWTSIISYKEVPLPKSYTQNHSKFQITHPCCQVFAQDVCERLCHPRHCGYHS